MQPPADPYRALGVSRGASAADIKAAHRRLAKRYHPDASGGDSARFLKVQEAYRVLSDPLLRREWDAAHAGPLRADRPAAPRPRRARGSHRASGPADDVGDAAKTGKKNESGAGPNAGSQGETPSSGRGRPRSARAYTWTATEVPWWEEGAARRGPRRETAAPGAAADPGNGPGREAGAAGSQPPDVAHDFDVYNRSSGAAWSMAARAYFRRGEQDLPRRGSFRQQGTQPLTAARARAAAEAESRQRAAPPASPPAARGAARPETAGHAAPRRPVQPAAGGAPAYAYASAGVARDPERVAHVREEYMRRTRALGWPSLRQRLLYALLAWLPIALLSGYGAFETAGCGFAAADCPPALEIGLIAFVGLLLVLLVALPRAAWAGAMGTLGMILAAAVATGVLAFMGAPLPPATAALIVLGIVSGIAYAAIVVSAALRGGPWRAAEPR